MPVERPVVAAILAERPLLAAVAFGTMLAPLNSTMIAVALPEIAGEFGVGVGEVSWLVVGYLIAMAVVQPIAGKLGDLYGRRSIFIGALGAFAIASIGATVAPSLTVLIALRICQAFFGAMAIPNGTALVREWVPTERRGSAFGLIGGAAGLAAGLGPPLGGFVVAFGGWRAIFWANLPLILVALVLAWQSFPADKVAHRSAASSGRFDFVGAALLAGTLAALALVASTLRAGNLPVAAALCVAGVVLGTLFVRNESHLAQPIVSLELFRTPTFAAASATVALGNLAMYSTLLTIPQFLSGVQHRESFEVGAVLAALSVPLAALSPVGGRLADRWGRRHPAVLGSAVAALGLAPFLAIHANWTVLPIVACLALAGCGLALQSPAIQAAALEVTSARQAGMASGVFSTSRYLGSIVGSAALAALLGASGQPTPDSLIAVFAMVETAAIGALVSAWLIRTG